MSVRPWKKIGSRLERSGVVSIRVDRYELPDGSMGEFDTITIASDAYAGVLALTPDGMIVSAVQFRWGQERVMYELPGGGVDPGESVLEAAKRELEEETGYTSQDWISLGSGPTQGRMPLIKHFFLARDCRLTNEQKLDSSEFIEVELLDRESFERVLEEGSCTDAEAWFRAIAKGLL